MCFCDLSLRETSYLYRLVLLYIGMILPDFCFDKVGQKRWKVDTNSRLNSALMLSAVNLPGGELRRRSAEDELLMREYLAEGDLISVSFEL